MNSRLSVAVYAFEYLRCLNICVENRLIGKYILYYTCGCTYFKPIFKEFFVIRLTYSYVKY
jgi:hypothetical protein